MENLITLNEGLENIKMLIEEAIKEMGATGKRKVINSSETINVLHEVVKSELIKNGVNIKLINPPLGSSKPEIVLSGFLKFKTQDVCVFPNHLSKVKEALEFDGLHKGKFDKYGELFSEHILTVNLRSQLSSIAKNKDTMFERTYAEPLNLHRRLPKMVLGEVYLLSARELDSVAVSNKKVLYKTINNKIANSLQEYIFGFSALNNRINQGDDYFKYERVALLIVDFSQNPIKVYNTSEELKTGNLLPAESKASLKGLTFEGFIADLIRIYERRFGIGILS